MISDGRAQVIGQVVEAIGSVCRRGCLRDDGVRWIEEPDNPSAHAALARVANAVEIGVLEHRAHDLHLEEEDVSLQVIIDRVSAEDVCQGGVFEVRQDEVGVLALEP